jgi:hypothetical protein
MAKQLMISFMIDLHYIPSGTTNTFEWVDTTSSASQQTTPGNCFASDPTLIATGQQSTSKLVHIGRIEWSSISDFDDSCNGIDLEHWHHSMESGVSDNTSVNHTIERKRNQRRVRQSRQIVTWRCSFTSMNCTFLRRL